MKRFLQKCVSAVKSTVGKVAAVVGALLGAEAVSTSAHAEALDVSAPIQAGIGTLNTNITTIAGAAIAIVVVFLAIRYFRRT